ncbi:MAG: DNA-directed RNA polymerase subunit H [Nanoarchaeota archaeon]|nr:DNA-directed RNA polymerase subunit H [Nanoarchaeota archaeon]
MAAKKNKTGAPEVSLPGKNEREINVLKHELVPAHRILADGERENLLEKFNIVAKQLPKILSADPVVKAADAKVGDVLEITRKSLSAGVAVYYRLVVA